MVRLEDHFQERARLVHCDGFELACLEAGPLVGVERQEAELLELDLV